MTPNNEASPVVDHAFATRGFFVGANCRSFRFRLIAVRQCDAVLGKAWGMAWKQAKTERRAPSSIGGRCSRWQHFAIGAVAIPAAALTDAGIAGTDAVTQLRLIRARKISCVEVMLCL